MWVNIFQTIFLVLGQFGCFSAENSLTFLAINHGLSMNIFIYFLLSFLGFLLIQLKTKSRDLPLKFFISTSLEIKKI